MKVLFCFLKVETIKFEALFTVADPGFPVGGVADLVGGGRQLPRRLRFEKFVCQNERIWTRRGERASGAPPGSTTDLVKLISSDSAESLMNSIYCPRQFLVIIHNYSGRNAYCHTGCIVLVCEKNVQILVPVCTWDQYF